MRKKANESGIDFSKLDKLPNKNEISLAATIQYLDLIPLVKKYLESKGKKVIIKKSAFHKGQILGCNSNAFDKSADTLLLLADGKFHAINNALQLEKEIYIFTTKTLERVTQKEIDEIKKRTESKKKKYLMSKQIGLLYSTKFGQQHKNIFAIKNKIEKTGKQVFIFEADNLDLNELENFPQIKLWINTACYGLSMDNPNILNLQEIMEFL